MAPSQEFRFILSKSRFRDQSAIFVENLKGTTFSKKIWPPPRKNPGYATASTDVPSTLGASIDSKK